MSIADFPSELDSIDVENVFIYVGDAVRWDALPNRIAERGTTIKTIAASTHSPSSFASLATGQYVPSHGVSTFSHRIADETPRIFDIKEVESTFVNSIFEHAERKHDDVVDPIYSVLGLDSSHGSSPLNAVSSPFIAMERGPGGHAPYGTFSGTATEYFERAGPADFDGLLTDYLTSVELDADLFCDRLDELGEQGVRDDTLVIYTSDHGELLGEGGMLGHSSPMRPELAYVPTVFVHPDLPPTTINRASLHHVDLVPTILDVLDSSQSAWDFDGTSAAKGLPSGPRPCSYFSNPLPNSMTALSDGLRYAGAWEPSGGFVFAECSRSDRLAVLGAKLARSSKRRYLRHRLGVVGLSYLQSSTRYGTPTFSRQDAKRLLAESIREPAESQQSDLSGDAEQQLRDLGYLGP